MKFVITGDQYTSLMAATAPYLKKDENADETAYYPIVSLYYDNDARDCYFEKLWGYTSRRKLRIRVYGSEDGKLPPTIFVEVKHKQDGRGVKRRVRVPLQEAFRICRGEAPTVPLRDVDISTCNEIKQLVDVRGFKPLCAMRYDRHAYADVNPESDLRVTFDTGIAYRFDNLEVTPDDNRFTSFLLPDGYAIMEVKVTGAVPYWLTKMIGEHHCILQGHSKYNNALEDGDPVVHKFLGGRPEKKHYGITKESIAASRAASAV